MMPIKKKTAPRLKHAARNENPLNLRSDYIDAKPRTVDWSELKAVGEGNGDVEGWRSWEAVECDECQQVVVVVDGMVNEEHRNFYDEKHCLGQLTHEGPMMNYFYPCDWRGDENEAAKKIRHLPLCIVEMGDGEKGLALTGGGMDLSIEICLAYIALGYAPPTHFCCHLPRMGQKLDKKMRDLIKAARWSLKCQKSWAESGLADLKAFSKALAISPRPRRSSSSAARRRRSRG